MPRGRSAALSKESNAMTITEQRVTCKCGHVFEAELVTHAPLAVSIASMNAVRCPKCGAGAKDIGLGGGYGDAPPPSASIQDRADWWLRRGETGISSKTIWCAFTGGAEHGPFGCSWPHDPDDYRRCKLLLDLIPEWRSNIGKVAARFPWFKPFSDRWDEFDALYVEESPGKRCPKLYGLMQIATGEARLIRYPKSEK